MNLSLKQNKVLLITGATGYLSANFLNYVFINKPDFFSGFTKVILLDRTLINLRLEKQLM